MWWPLQCRWHPVTTNNIVSSLPEQQMFSSPPSFSDCGIASIRRSVPYVQRRHQFLTVYRAPAAPGRRRDGASNPQQLVSSLLGSSSDAIEATDGDDQSPDLIGGEKGDGGGGQSSTGFSSKELVQKLKRYGVAGVLSYGLLNTVYYVMTFLFVWFYLAPAPGRMGYAASVQRFFKLMAIVWAGSQVTKIFRAGGALALAPFVDRGLSWFTTKLKFESEGKAFAAIVCLCFGVALLLFFGLTLMWA